MTEAQEIIENAKAAWKNGEISTEQLFDVWRMAQMAEDFEDWRPPDVSNMQ